MMNILADFAAHTTYLEFSGIRGSVNYDPEDNILWGELLDVPYVMASFEGDTVEAFKEDFHDAIQDYLDIVHERELKAKAVSYLTQKRRSKGLSVISASHISMCRDSKGRVILRLNSTGAILLKRMMPLESTERAEKGGYPMSEKLETSLLKAIHTVLHSKGKCATERAYLQKHGISEKDLHTISQASSSEDEELLALAVIRMKHYAPAECLTWEEMNSKLGITQADLDRVGDIEFE